MNHWEDPHSRGLYDHPASSPPQPLSREHNDLGSRVARLEEHTRFAAWDRGRIERESRLRARDLGEAMESIGGRITLLEHDRTERRNTMKIVKIFGGSAIAFGRYAAAGILGLLLLTGKVSIEAVRSAAEGVKLFLGLLGSPSG